MSRRQTIFLDKFNIIWDYGIRFKDGRRIPEKFSGYLRVLAIKMGKGPRKAKTLI